MHERSVEGIVLKSQPFKDSGRILRVFTAEKGMITLFIKDLSKRHLLMTNLTSPLCRAKFILQKRRSELYHLIDGTIVDLHMQLRRSYTCLQFAGKMLHAITSSQMPGKPTPLLYALLTKYLKQLAHFHDPMPLWSSFQLKILQHEGVLSLDAHCLCCHKERASCISQGESRCMQCNRESTLYFSSQEWKLLLQFLRAKKFEELKNIKIGSKMEQAIDKIYTSYLRTDP